VSPEGWPRITDLSGLDAEDFKYRNTKFLNSDDQPYETGFDESWQRLRHQVWNVRNGDLREVLRQFPREDPLREQCAGWMHAVVGKHFFPDANHRTAVALLRRLLGQNGIEYEPWSPARLLVARKESHTVRGRIEPVRLDTLYRRDRLYDVWSAFFTDELIVTNADE
jgi:prophage maintenance system killer protein